MIPLYAPSFLVKKALDHGFFLKVFCGILGVIALSQISFPLQPVPLTLQTLGMLFIGLTYSRKEAFGTATGWLTLGLLGAPVFAGYAGGFPLLLGPRGGFILGLALTPVAMAWVRERWKLRGLLAFSALALLGQSVLWLCGLGWLGHLIGFKQAFVQVCFPFLLWEGVKTPCAVLLAYALQNRP